MDGHPESQLPVLAEFIRRDGVDRTVSTLLAQTWGWCFLDPNPEKMVLASSASVDYYGRFELVPGYGCRYTEKDSSLNRYGDASNAGRLDALYVYVIEQDGTISYAGNDGALWDDLDWKRTSR
jgi:hypothetical protein